MTCPPSLQTFGCDRLDLCFERVEQRQCRRTRCLVTASVRIDLDQIEIDTTIRGAIRLIDEGRRCDREAETRRESESFLRAGQHVIELPLVEMELRSAESA